MADDIDRRRSGTDDDMTEPFELSQDGADTEIFSLESILAEFKSSAFIAGDRKTPSDELERKASMIVQEVVGSAEGLSEAAEPAPEARRKESAPETPPLPEVKAEAPPETAKAPPETASAEKTGESVRPGKVELSVDELIAGLFDGSLEDSPEDGGLPDGAEIVSDLVENDDPRYFESFRFSDPDAVDRFARELSINLENESLDGEEEPDEPETAGFFHRLRRRLTPDRSGERAERVSSAGEEEEPDIMKEAERFAAPLRSLKLRTLTVGVLCLVMALFTLLFEKGTALPLGIGTDITLTVGVLLILELTVMALGMDVLLSGVRDVLHCAPGCETLTALSCAVTVLDGIVMLSRGTVDQGLPFCVVSAVSLFFAMRGRINYYTAMSQSLRMTQAVSSPSGVVSEDGGIEGRAILKKLRGRTAGFYGNLIQADMSETAYLAAAPIFIAAGLLFALLSSVGNGRGADFAHCNAVIVSMTAAFPAASAFALPFKNAAARAKRAGGALAGWGGVCEISDADAALITDEDIFPLGSVSLSGIKLFDGADQQKTVVYTSSLIMEAHSELSRVFEELLKSQHLSPVRIDGLSCYEGGGIGALIDGNRVVVGTGGFMNLMGVRVPESVNSKNAVFTAVNDELAAVFTINYVPANSVQGALLSMLQTRMGMLLAARDFNVTPGMIQQKFKVSMEGVEIVPVETGFRLSEESAPRGCRAAAVLCREGLAPFAEVIAQGRILKQITRINTVISMVGSAIGTLLMFFLMWNSSYGSATAWNALLFMAGVEAASLLLSVVMGRRI